MRHLGINAIVLKKQNSGEYDQFITLFSPALGKIGAIAKGARKIDSSFIGHLEVLNICQFELYRSTKNYTIVQCQSQKIFRPLRENFNRAVLALLLLEIFQKSTTGQEQGEMLFELLEGTLERLGRSRKNFIIIETFKIKLLELLGVLPDISRCSHCSKKWQNSSIIKLSHDGQMNCEHFQNNAGAHEIIPFNMMKLVHFLSRSNFEEVEKINLQPSEEKFLQKISGIFLQNYIHREIFSEKILAELTF